MSRHDQITALKEIAKRVGDVPHCYSHDPLLLDSGTVAGELLLQAMQHGLFSEPRFVELRQLIEISQRGEFKYQRLQKLHPSSDIVPPLVWHAFRTAGSWLAREAGRSRQGMDETWVRQTCEEFAEAMNTRIAKLESELRLDSPMAWLESALRGLEPLTQ